MPYQVVVPKGSAPPLAPYSHGAKAGNALYVSGTLALDSAGTLVRKGDILNVNPDRSKTLID